MTTEEKSAGREVDARPLEAVLHIAGLLDLAAAKI
jgi:hypothetical protein